VTIIEANIGVVCGCLHGIKPLMAAVFPRLFRTSGLHASSTGRSAPYRAKRLNTYLSESTRRDSAIKPEHTKGKGSWPSPSPEDLELAIPPAHLAAWTSRGDDEWIEVPENRIGYMRNVVVDGVRVSRLVRELGSLDEQNERHAMADGVSEAGSEVDILPPHAITK